MIRMPIRHHSYGTQRLYRIDDDTSTTTISSTLFLPKYDRTIRVIAFCIFVVTYCTSRHYWNLYDCDSPSYQVFAWVTYPSPRPFRFVLQRHMHPTYRSTTHHRDYTITTKLHLQFQAGDMMDDNNHSNEIVSSSTTNNIPAASMNVTTTTAATMSDGTPYATISSVEPSPISNMDDVDDSIKNAFLLQEQAVQKKHALEQWHSTIRELQQIYGPESISIVHDDELDETIIIDNDDPNENTIIPINTLIFVWERPTDPSLILPSFHRHYYRSYNDYIMVILGNDRRVNVTALQHVVEQELLLQYPSPPSNTASFSEDDDDTVIGSPNSNMYRVQLAPRDAVESVCGFAPGTVPPIPMSGNMDTTTSPDRSASPHRQLPPLEVRSPILTIVDEALVSASRTTSSSTLTGVEDVYLIGGGGQPNHSCRVTIDVLLQQYKTVVGTISYMHSSASSSSAFQSESNIQSKGVNGNDGNTVPIPDASMVYPNDPSLSRSKPYFAIAGPSDTYEAKILLAKLNDTDSSSRSTKNEPILQDGWDAVWEYQQIPKFDTNEIVTFVGRIGKVRRMARELSFCDLLPPDIDINTMTSDDDGDNTNNNDMVGIDIIYPWRNPVTDTKMAVQLICGKTLCQNSGSDHAIRQLHAGQIVFIQGRTNLQSKNSLRNWIYNQTLDIVVLSYLILAPVPIVEKPAVAATTIDRRRTTAARKIATNEPLTVNVENCLRLNDLYDDKTSDNLENANINGAITAAFSDSVVNGETKVNGDNNTTIVSSHAVVIDDFPSVKRFTKDLSQVLQTFSITKPSTIVDQSSSRTLIGLVGIDCEWKPNFFMESSRDPQPVLVLQISLHPLKRVYLFDLQTLLRPMMPQSQPMDKLELEVSFALQALFESKRLIKVGFHVVNDLRQLAASYPHIPGLQFYNAVIEASTLGKKAIRRTQSGNAREATSSLSRLVNHFIGKPLNKQEQCSDWSKRPFTAEQIEYAALDAAVTPIMVEKMISDLEASFFGDKPYLGRWESDMSFKTAISSLRFVFIHTIDPNVQRKLKAKQVVGDPMIVSQSWITGDVPPKLPMLPESDSDGTYTDVHGIVQIPSVSVTIRSNHIGDVIDSMIGKKVGTSKDMCVSNFLHRPTSFPDGARLEYPQRSGFVEFKDGVVLFVNMQSATGNRFKSKSYPNEWLLDGKILTWFLRENDWQRGETPLAKKLLADPSSVFVTLFVRMGRAGEFVCCGRCRVQDTDEINGYRSLPDSPDSWSLIKLNLMLLDWKKLQSSAHFQSLLSPSVDANSDSDFSAFE